MPEDLRKAPLMMVETLPFLVMYAADIYNNVAGIEDGRIPGPLQT